ncbi:transmembrane protein 134 isoform X2 [Hippopotamus amphibius kiboko]|uniref:transmembrane protein 134 isoform X2 n=1 Tax=Hippopotamus amphibius kiboko TaxID=575201 RepID=UPI0025944A4E|nr:transmembrane protein 134 isoform X2 [Hippopotamus amphibius kiboko]
MSAARPQFSIDDAFELSLEDAGPGPESSGIARFGPLHFERRARFEVADEDKQSRLRYQNLENDEDGAQASPEPDGGVSTRDSGRTSIRSSQWSFSTISSSTQRSYNACCSADPDRRGTGGGPLASLPRDLHLLRREGSPRLPVLLPALLREVSTRRRGRRDPASAPRGHVRPPRVPRGRSWGPRPASVPSSQGKSPSGTLEPPVPLGVCSGSLGHVGLGPLPGPEKVAPSLLCALTYSRALGLRGWWCFVLIKRGAEFQPTIAFCFPLALISTPSLATAPSRKG